MTDPIIINEWQTATADSAHLGLGLVRNADIESFPGAVRVGKKPTTLFTVSTTSTFTADAGTDTLTTASNVSAMTTGVAVSLTTTGTLPAPLTTGSTYFTILLGSTSLQLGTSIANASAGSLVNITDAGTGTHTVSTINPTVANYIIKDPRTSTLFLHDSSGRVWYKETSVNFKLLAGNTLTASAGNGIALSSFSSTTATFLFVFRNALVDVVDVFGTSQKENPSWTSAWLSLNSGSGSGNPHHAINAQDNVIYFVDDRYVGSIREASGATFNPAVGTTYSATNNSLDLPPQEVGQYLEELGVNLMIAGGTFNYVYPWDRSSSSYNLALPVPETSVKKLKNIGNVVYILAGTKGNIYKTQGTYVTDFKSLPFQVVNSSATVMSNPITWGGIAARNGSLLVGVGAQTGSNSGVYLIYPDGRLLIDAIPSTGATRPTAIYADNDFYTFGYSAGADDFLGLTRYTSFETVLQSKLYKVATKTEKGTLSTLEVQIAKPASTGHIRVGYRQDTSSTFTTIATYTADGSATSFETDAGLSDIENIQIQVEMDGDMELMEVRLLP